MKPQISERDESSQPHAIILFPKTYSTAIEISSEVPVGSHPPQHHRAFDSLRLGRSPQTIHAQLLRFWDTPNMINSNEIRGITMVLLDDEKKNRLTFHKLADVVGVIKSVKGFGLLSTNIFSPILIRNVEVYLSLLDEAAARFKGLLNSGESTNSVMVVTNSTSDDTIIILSSDHMYLHSTAATKFYFGNNLAAITEFTTSIDSSLSDAVGKDLPSLNAETDLPSLNAETVITTKELSSTGDLSKFLSNSSRQSLITQEAYFTCIAQIVEVVAQKGWYYVSCTHCVKEDELLVDGGENYATFLVLDNEMMKLTKQDAATLPKIYLSCKCVTDNAPTFTISGMSAVPNKEILTINAKKKEGKMEYGESSTSAAATYTSTNEADKDGPKYSTE
ncbi:hypothetical protein HID58_092706 [Brassica napus]|uniref:Replication factor A C-terminal domain-containing protein n=1 Tax=Brassica napus TaxID=3708 RepID=A0ABQ7XDG5_BRANA|nr:hypothetical protein HID58_092706 [Brassica napus]